MSLPRGFVSYLVIGILSIIILYQYIGASKAERRAEQLEVMAKDIDAQLQSFRQASEQREALAESRYQASQAESATLRAILAKGSERKPVNPPQSLQEALRQPQEAAKPTTPSQAAQSLCEPFIYKGDPLVIEGFQVAVCDQQPVVQAEAAVAYRDEKALVDKLTVQLSEATAKLVLEEKDIAAYKTAEASYKKAAKKSRFKKAMGVAEKVGLFAAGVFIGHRL